MTGVARLGRRSWLAAASAAAAAVAGASLAARGQAAPLVRFATSPTEGYAQAFFAQDAGLFAKAGVNADVQIVSTGAAISAAVAGGTVDVGVATIVNLANAVTRGIPFVLIAPAVLATPKVPPGLLCVATASPIRNAKDFEGKIIAVPALRQVADLAVRVWLSKGGADPAKVQIVEAPFPEMGAGVERGTYAGAAISEPALSAALNRNVVRSLADPYAAIAPEYAIAGWFTTAAYLQKYPDAVRRAAAALMESGRWANTHRSETAAIVARITKTDAEAIRNAPRPLFGEDMKLAEIQPQLDAAFKFGFLSRAVSASELAGR
jgi:NitT/TauT family transport system substrate-binding protein